VAPFFWPTLYVYIVPEIRSVPDGGGVFNDQSICTFPKSHSLSRDGLITYLSSVLTSKGSAGAKSVYLAARLGIDFKRRLELSSLTRRQDRSRSFRTFRLVAVAVVQAAVVVR